MENKLFSTRDLNLASVFITLKFPLVSIDFQVESDKIVGYMNFDGCKELYDAETKFWAGNLAVEPRNFIMNMRGLKAQLTNTFKGPRVDTSNFKRVNSYPP